MNNMLFLSLQSNKINFRIVMSSAWSWCLCLLLLFWDSCGTLKVFLEASLPWTPKQQGTRQKRELHWSLEGTQTQKSSTRYLQRECNESSKRSWTSGLTPRDTRMIQHIKINKYNILHKLKWENKSHDQKKSLTIFNMHSCFKSS